MEHASHSKVAKILRNLDQNDLLGTFEREGFLDLGAFLFLTEEKLDRMGVPFGPRLLILNEIQRLKRKVPTRKHTFLTPICDFCAEKSVGGRFVQYNLKDEKFEDVFELSLALHLNPLANVWIARWKKEEKYAVAKIIKKTDEKAARAEIACLNQLQGCKYVVELLKVWERPTDFVLLFPVHKADLPFGFCASDLQLYMHALLNALNEIHSKGIVHGDISLGNLLYDRSKNKLLLIDFGSAAAVGVQWQKPAPFSLEYVAPERRERNGTYHPLSDVYSAGVLFKHLKKKSNWSDQAEDLYSSIGSPKMGCRISAERALLHPYFESLFIMATPPSRPSSPNNCLSPRIEEGERKRKRD